MEKYRGGGHLINPDEKITNSKNPSTSFPLVLKQEDIMLAVAYYKDVYMYRKGETVEMRAKRLAQERLKKKLNKKIHANLVSQEHVPLMESDINILGQNKRKHKMDRISSSSSTRPPIKREVTIDSDMIILQDIFASSSALEVVTSNVSTFLEEQNDLTPDFNVKIKEEPLDAPIIEAMDFEDNNESVKLAVQQILTNTSVVADITKLPHKFKIKLEDVTDQTEKEHVEKETKIKLEKEDLSTNIDSDSVTLDKWKNGNIKIMRTYMRNKMSNNEIQHKEG